MARAHREASRHRRALRAFAAGAVLIFELVPHPAAAQQQVPPVAPVTPFGSPDADIAPLFQPPPAPPPNARSGSPLPSPPALSEFYDTLPPFNAPHPPSIPQPPLRYPQPGEPPPLP